jgi:flagellar protein FliO/FliZ
MGTFELFIRTLLALGVVLGLVWGLSRLSRRLQSGGRRNGGRRLSLPSGNQGPRITVLTKRSLSRSAAIAVVRVGDRDFVVGTTTQSITLITELAPQEGGDQSTVDDALATTAATDRPWKATSRQAPQAWDAVITTLREKTTRH